MMSSARRDIGGLGRSTASRRTVFTSLMGQASKLAAFGSSKKRGREKRASWY
jgi:hypothetical protein